MSRPRVVNANLGGLFRGYFRHRGRRVLAKSIIYAFLELITGAVFLICEYTDELCSLALEAHFIDQCT